MPTWTGWREAFEKALGVNDTSDNRDFLRDWAAHANSNCANNPIDVSHTALRSANCATLPGGHHAQRFPNHAEAAQAFALQMRSGNYPLLLQGFQSGHPQATRTVDLLAAELRAWGSAQYATWFLNQAGGGIGGGGGGGGGVKDAHAHHGWADLRRSVNHHMPAALRSSQRGTAAALRSLSRARKVRL